MLWRILETRGNIFKIATEKNLEGGKRLKEVFEKNKERLESGPFPLGQLRTAGFIKESHLYWQSTSVVAWLQRRHGAIEPRGKKRKNSAPPLSQC